MTHLIATLGTTVNGSRISVNEAEVAQAMDEAQALKGAVTAAAAKKAEVRDAYDLVPEYAAKAPAPSFPR